MDEPIEERLIRCTYCNDSGWVHSSLQHPCPFCNHKEYKAWRDEGKDQLPPPYGTNKESP